MPQDQEDALIAQEIELESQGVARAVKSFWESWERTRLSDSKAGKSLLEMALPPLTEAVRNEQEKIKAGARPRYWQEFVSVQADRLAYITIMSILDGYRGSKEDKELTKYTFLAKRVGDWAKLEYRVEQEPEADRIRRWIAAGHDKNPSRARKRYKPFKKRGWAGKQNSIKLGGALLGLAVDHGAGLFQLYEKVMESHRIRLTVKGLRALAECRHRQELAIRPKWLPTVKPPLPWVGNEGGGFKDFALSLVKRDEDPDIQEALKKADLRIVCEAINALQATPYRINQRVHEVVAAVAERKGPVAVLP
jgi:DNA-directed RNA polymerase